ncbi:MAG TPA: alpha/beta hydrolase [Thermoanaerobaculia bacterium]|nr:alpha/beta hydrolase [Thermoanaerobaculia bacterium]
MKRLISALFMFLMAAGTISAGTLVFRPAAEKSRLPLGSTTYLGLEFANVDGQALKLDLYIPNAKAPYPVIVSVHGGSWTTGTRDEGTAVLQVSRGYAVANIDYRLAPGSRFPAQIEDCKAAVRWLRANAARFSLDSNAVGVMGYSAGGHLAALLGTTGDVQELEGIELGNPGFSSRVRAVVDYFGPTDLLKLASQALPCEPGDPNDPKEAPSLLIGCPIQSCPAATEKANPIQYVTADDAAFLILHGTSDCLVPWQQSQILYDALRVRDVDARLVLVPFAGHADRLFLSPTYQDKVNDFLDKHLKNLKRPRGARR